MSEPLLDAEALAALYYEAVLRLGWRLTGSREQGEDIAQEVFMHLHRRGIKLDPAQAPLAYVRRMAARRAYEHLRQPSHLPMPEEEYQQPSTPATAHKSLEKQREMERLMRAVANLPPKTRAVFILREIEEVEPEEVAKMLGILQVTVRRHLMIAHQKLRVILER